MGDRDISSWNERLTDQAKRGYDNYQRRRFYLATTRTGEGEPFSMAGEFLYVEQASSESALAAVSLNRPSNDPISLKVGTIIKTIFTELWITNSAQAGQWIDVVIGINFEYYQDKGGMIGSRAQPAITLTNAVANTNTVAAAHVCNQVLLRAHPDNTGRIWVNFGTPVVAINTCYPLDAGEIIVVKLRNTSEINAWFTVANDILIIIYQV